jgi:HEAT repeat protein
MAVRLAAIQTLGALKDKEAIPALREVQKDPAEAVRNAARRAIEAIGS